ncbi:DUF3311 domain-containing protein [Bacillus sp. 03113]|uniref:DUF3311 domain-containing protein n=1 Tax=Bacillus sp. 03113 TaxID=2578211 RepID=UPI001143344D|nr:DUF3311 domain-containing protein [Bacillus sp. 03113]
MDKKFIIFLLAVIPFLQLALLPFVNRIEPLIFGLPLIHFWFFLSVVITPLCTWGIYALQKPGRSKE